MNKLSKNSRFGLVLAVIGALLISPDTLFIRLSQMDVWAVLSWRGGQMGMVLLLIWGISKWMRPKHTISEDIKAIISREGVCGIFLMFLSGVAFAYGVVQTSVAIILFSLATMPLFSALFSRLILGEPLKKSTFLVIIICLFGIGLAISDGHSAVGAPNGSVIIGGLCGLLAAASLGLVFVLFRANASVPLLPVNGLGALLSVLAYQSVVR